MSTRSTTLHKTHELGQSIWYDNIRRGLLTSGELRGLVDDGVRGITSNPTIFDKAISGSHDYDDDLIRLVKERRSAHAIYEELALDDIRAACDLLRPVYDDSAGVDGRVSLEVLPELAANTDQTVAEGLRLAHLVGRPNVMIKVPATPEGLPAIRALTAQGVSVNVTLIFSLEQYEEVADAYLAGLEDRVASGASLAGLASVASFFVSRVDAVCDKQLLEKTRAGDPEQARRAEALMGKLAIANAKLAYEMYQATIAGPRWKRLLAQGANPQRLLWASTGTKDPRYADTMYLDALIGPDTVNTVPPATLTAFLDHGRAEGTLAKGLDEARNTIAAFAELGLDLGKVCRGLLADGVKSFSASMAALMSVISARRAALLEQVSGRQRLTLPPRERDAYDAELAAMVEKDALRRLWEGDATFFTPDPAHEKSIKNRLGWLRAPALMRTKLGELHEFAAEIQRDGFRFAVLLGMGGSSLCPEVLSRAAASIPRGADRLSLLVLDNTDPAAVAAVDKQIDLKSTLFIVASKSGGTIEIQAFERYFWNRVLTAAGGDVAVAGRQFIAITDPATRLGQLAEEKKYRRVFTNPADIGGRYSALSYFGLVPAALLGGDFLDGLVETGLELATASSPTVPTIESPGVLLGAAVGALARKGRDKLTFVIPPQMEALGSWIEQLVAESTGKEGKGIVPVDLEPLGSPEAYGDDRAFVYIRYGDGAPLLDIGVTALENAGFPVILIGMEDARALGREFFRWEMATAIAGSSLGVNPFDEPNVTEAKLATSALLAQHAKEGQLPQPEPDGVCAPSDAERIHKHLALAGPGDYLALCGYFLRTEMRDQLLTQMRVAFRDNTRNATTLGYGPRFLHSTGQLHKGGANNGVFLQLTADVGQDLPVPGESYSFATLRNAQALGDLQVLRRRSRRALRVHLGNDIEGGLSQLAAVFEDLAKARKSA
ncbi:MAG TPA: bifunctional transaldolase/phosoglucose isomerase [Polyangia bacterium]|nr:bifunctional transaldolase/phosoglucose isomerase [Polyangia bacterium]